MTTPTPKLNLGCGRCYLPPEDGWLNVDFFTTVKADGYHDVTNLPYERGSFSLVYVSHLLEHCHRHAIVSTLSHWRSLLVDGGILRLAVPDFAAISEHYQLHGDIEVLMGLLYGRQDMHLNRHTVAFDEKYLTFLLQRSGFGDVRRWDWRTTEHAKFDDFSRAVLPHLDFENGMQMSLNLQATKL